LPPPATEATVSLATLFKIECVTIKLAKEMIRLSGSSRSARKLKDSMTGPSKIKVVRIEAYSADDPGSFAKVTFRIDYDVVSFYLPVLVDRDLFDEADLTKVARSLLHQTLIGLSQQTEGWKLTEQELEQLPSWKFYPGA
jgi:hypothetical protein